MEAEDTPANTPPDEEPLSGEEIRRATFPQALRGYDRQAVHDMLDRVADWMEGRAGTISNATPDMREEIAKVGERTTGILTAAEDAARKLREEATEYAERLRADAEDETRKARLNASQKMDEMIGEAEEKAKAIIDDAIARRRQLNVAISSLIDRRDEIAADATGLAEELLGAVEDLRRSDPRDEVVTSAGAPPGEPPSEEASSLEAVDARLAEELLGAVKDLRRSDARDEVVTPAGAPPGEPPSEEASSLEAVDEEPPSQEEPVAERPSEEELVEPPSEELPLEEEETTEVHPGPDHDRPAGKDGRSKSRRKPTLLVDPDEED